MRTGRLSAEGVVDMEVETVVRVDCEGRLLGGEDGLTKE